MERSHIIDVHQSDTQNQVGMDISSEGTPKMRVIDLLKALVDLPIELLREACRVNPDAEVWTEGCDCWGDVAWVDVPASDHVRLLRDIPLPPRPRSPRTWFTREGHRVPAGHPEAFVEINDAWTKYFETGEWPPQPHDLGKPDADN